jgi:uncharacterized membrane protein YedE/YeeE
MLHQQLPWYFGGPVLGLCVVAIRLLLNGRLGLTGSFSEVIERVGRRSLAFDWRGWVLIGLVAGSVLFAIVGAVFGVTLSGSGLTDPEVIRSGLLFEQSYLFLFVAAALGVAFAGTQLLRLMRPRALLTGERVDWVTEKPDRRRFGGAVLFGTGWAVTGACPGPIAAQLGQGVLWSVFTLAGVVIGIVAFLAVQRRGRGERGLRRRLAADRYALAVDGKQL